MRAFGDLVGVAMVCVIRAHDNHHNPQARG